MPCEAKTYPDGSWVCWHCDIGGDKDEDPADYCKMEEQREADDIAETDSKPAKP